jgi:uncharacterized protein
MSTLRHWITLPYRRYPMLTGGLLPLIVLALFVVMPRMLEPPVQEIDPLGRTALTLAAERGEHEAVMEMIDAGTPVDERDRCGWTALMKAAANGHLAMLKKLLARGANPEHRDEAGYTALMVAIVNGREATSRALLEVGADVHAVDDEAGWSSLIWAARNGNEELTSLLLAHGADPAHVADGGTTPLQLSREGGHAGVVSRLEAAGARK